MDAMKKGRARGRLVRWGAALYLAVTEVTFLEVTHGLGQNEGMEIVMRRPCHRGFGVEGNTGKVRP